MAKRSNRGVTDKKRRTRPRPVDNLQHVIERLIRHGMFNELATIVFSMMGSLLLVGVLQQFLEKIPANQFVSTVLGVGFFALAIAIRRKRSKTENAAGKK